MLRQHLVLPQRDERAHVGRRCAAEIDDDVGVNMRNLGIADAMSFQAALINQPAGSDTFNLFKY